MSNFLHQSLNLVKQESSSLHKEEYNPSKIKITDGEKYISHQVTHAHTSEANADLVNYDLTPVAQRNLDYEHVK